MKNWAWRVLGMAGLCLTWAAAWAAGGLLIGAASLLLPFLPWEAFFRVFDAPLPALGLPGFIGGGFFSLLVWFAERRRGAQALTFARFCAWGAMAGILVSLVPAALVSAGLATLNSPGFDLWKMTAIIGLPLALLGAASGLLSLTLAKAAGPWRKLLSCLLYGRGG
jgi:hypothetical protein